MKNWRLGEKGFSSLVPPTDRWVLVNHRTPFVGLRLSIEVRLCVFVCLFFCLRSYLKETSMGVYTLVL